MIPFKASCVLFMTWCATDFDRNSPLCAIAFLSKLIFSILLFQSLSSSSCSSYSAIIGKNILWYLFRSPFALFNNLSTNGNGRSRSTTSSWRTAKLTASSTHVPQRITATEYSPRLKRPRALFQFLATFSSSLDFKYGVRLDFGFFLDFDLFM